MIKALIRTLTGKNRTGEILHGVLDVAPIPPIHNLFRLAVKEKVPAKQVPLFIWQKLDKVRLSTSALAIGLGLAVLKGWISIEDAKLLIEYVAMFL